MNNYFDFLDFEDDLDLEMCYAMDCFTQKVDRFSYGSSKFSIAP